MIAVVFQVFTHVDRMLTELTIVCLTHACTLIDDLAAIAHPVRHILVACGIVHARVADTLVHIDVAVAAEGWIAGVVIALHDGALCRELGNKARQHNGGAALCTVRAAAHSVATVLTHTIRKAIDTGALVRVERHGRLHRRFSACSTVLARAAITLIDINVTVASEPRCEGLQMRSDQSPVVTALEHCALSVEL